MDDTLILQKLDALSQEIKALKGEVAELRREAAPIAGQLIPDAADCLSEQDLAHRREDFAYFLRSLVLNVETLNSLMATAKGAMELKDEIEPVAKLVVPKLTDLMSDLEGTYNLDDIAALLRNTLGNLHHFNTAITMLKAGMELKDEIEPLAKLTLPQIIETFNELSGVLQVAGAGFTALRGCAFSPAQAEAMCQVIATIDLSRAGKIGPIGAVKKLYDPNVQEALGVVFTLVEAIGALFQAYKSNK